MIVVPRQTSKIKCYTDSISHVFLINSRSVGLEVFEHHDRFQKSIDDVKAME